MRTFSLKIVVAFGLGLNEHLAMAVQIPFDFLVTLLGEVPARAMIAEAGLPADGTPISHLDLWQLLGNNIERTGDERHELGPQAVPNGSFELLLAAMRLGYDLGDGLARLAAASRIVWPDMPLMVQRGHDLRLRVPGTSQVTAQRRLYIELVFLVLHTACCWMAGRKLEPLRLIAPLDDAPGNGAGFALLGCPVVRRGDDMELLYPAGVANLRIVADRFDLSPSLLFETFARSPPSRRRGSASPNKFWTFYGRLRSIRRRWRRQWGSRLRPCGAASLRKDTATEHCLTMCGGGRRSTR